jgi:hypothetical protein
MQNRIFALALALVGCGGNSGGGGGSHFSTSVSGSTPVASLTPAQQAQICSDAQGFAKSISADVCKAEGILAAAELSLTNSSASNADLQAACTAASADCTNGVADAGTGQCDFSSFQSASCTATVAQLSACLNDTGAAEDQAVAKLPSCSSLTTQNLNATLDQDAGASSSPASCVAFDNACPGEALTGIMGTKM